MPNQPDPKEVQPDAQPDPERSDDADADAEAKPGEVGHDVPDET